MKEAVYLAEQDEMFGCYIDRREEFEKDWESGEYSPDCTMRFDVDEVEVLEEMTKSESKQW